MAKYCAKCGKALPDGEELCPDCHVPAQETDAALFTRMTAETEVWKEDDGGKKPKRVRPKATRSQKQKLLYGAAALLAVLVIAAAILFVQPGARIGRAIRAGDYDRALTIYWNTTDAAAGTRSARLDSQIRKAAEDICAAFSAHEVDAETAARELSQLGSFGEGAADMLEDVYASFRALTASRDHRDAADKLFLNGEYLAAREEYLLVIEADSDYESSQEQAAVCLDKYAESVLSSADVAIQTGDYGAAVLALEAGRDTLETYETFSEKLDSKLLACHELLERSTLEEAENLAALADYQAAAELLRQTMERYDHETEAMQTAMDGYLAAAEDKQASDAVKRADELYVGENYADAFALLKDENTALGGENAALTAALEAMEKRFTEDKETEAREKYDHVRENLPDAIAILDAAIKVRELPELEDVRDELRAYLPVSLAEMDYAEKDGTIFRSASTFESLDGTEFTDGWIFGANGASLTFDLGGNYDLFTASLAVRREDTANANASFELWLDGERIYKSETLYHWQTDPIAVEADISGGRELKIVFIADYNISTLDNGYCYHGLCTPTITKNLDSPYEKAE